MKGNAVRMSNTNALVSGAPETCPVCGSPEFAPSDQTIDLPTVLAQWEEAVDCKFPDEVKAYYATADRSHSALLACASCGFGLFFPTITGSAGFYQQIEAGNYYNAEKWEFQQALKFISNLRTTSLLDIGCGAGAFLDQLKMTAPSVRRCGHELNPEMRPVLEGNGHEFMSEPLARLEPGSFDVITAFQILEHVENPLEMLRDIYDLVRPGGGLFVTTPNQAGPIQNFTESLTEIPPHHVSRWSPGALQLAIEKAGFVGCQLMPEPLAQVLWDTYLPLVMEDNCWVSTMYGNFIEHLNSMEKAGFVHRELQRTGIKYLYGVVGHSVLVMARKSLNGQGSRNVG
jgi:SAM-dependent methyltransferase